MFNFRATILHIAAIAIHTAPAFAQTTPTGTIEQDIAKRIKKTNEKDFISLSVENDMLGGGTDRYYTSGVRLTWFNVSTPVPPVIDKLADNIPTFDLNETTSTFFTIGQNLYTPENIKIASNQNNDRPWAGFLYSSVGVATLEDNHIDELEVTLGVAGPEALGEQTQKFVHKEISNSPTPRGWKNQIDFEPGLILSAARRWPRFYHEEHAGFRLTAEPNINASIGNIYTYAGAGMSLSLSPDDGALRDKPPRVRPAMPGSGYFETPENGMGWVLFAGLDARAVARDIFLDGNTFKDSHNVDKNHFIA
ncbi:MAG: lipid A deacylase LpxR family protein, partial [Alphaproteobacteria bacterium]